MEIRPPQKPNYPDLAKFFEAVTGISWDASFLASRVMGDQFYDPNLVLMAREQGVVLGFAITVLQQDKAWIKFLGIAPHRRRQGLAREILERLEERLSGEGAQSIHAGFGPGPLIYPGVPEGEAAAFFEAMGYRSKPGGFLATIDSPSAPDEEAARVEAHSFRDLMQAQAPDWWSEVEEAFSDHPPRLGLSADAKALCLVEPGTGIGPLFYIDEKSAPAAIQGALARAGRGRRLLDFREPAWWQAQLRLREIRPCRQFEKDLRGVSHA